MAEITLAAIPKRRPRLQATIEAVAEVGNPTVIATLTVVAADNTALMAFDKAVAKDAPGRVSLSLPLAGLGRGAYRLRVTATDGEAIPLSALRGKVQENPLRQRRAADVSHANK